MFYDLENRLVVGVSSRALFDLSCENEIFEKEGVEAYCRYQVEHEDEILKPGPGFPLIKALLNLNRLPGKEGCVEVIIMSRNSPDTSLRVFNAIAYYGLNITRAVLASGASLAPYLEAFRTDLFLSAYEDDVQSAIDSNIAAGIICSDGIHTYDCEHQIRQIRIAFDGDAVLFSDESERISRECGLKAFEENERENAGNPLKAGPFAKFLRTLSELQKDFPTEEAPIRTALVTLRCAPAHERVIRTLRAWNVRIDEAFFLGGVQKTDVLKAFGAHIFFDDQAVHTKTASEVVPSARVPYKKSPPGSGDYENASHSLLNVSGLLCADITGMRIERKYEVSKYITGQVPVTAEPVHSVCGAERGAHKSPCEKYGTVSGTFAGECNGISGKRGKSGAHHRI